jgi:curved DNA-binding protein CbpA
MAPRHRTVLGVPADASCEEIRKAFRRKASSRTSKYRHPDKGGTQDLFARLVEARDALLAGELEWQDLIP